MNLIQGNDIEIANWAFTMFNMRPVPFCMAIGIVADRNLVGACLFHAHSGPDVELSYYGPNTLTLPIVKGLARIAVEQLGVSRVTVRTSRSNKTVTRGIRKIGFQFEGVRKFGYGDDDALMYGIYGENLARLAGKELH